MRKLVKNSFSERRMRSLFSILLILACGLGAYAQEDDGKDEGKYGSDSANCVMNLSLYKEFVKQKNYDDAFQPWRVCFNICPAAARSIYSDGITILKNKITKTKDPVLKASYIDTLFLVYDQRIQYFGTNKKYPEGWILGRKGSDMYKYRPDNANDIYACLSKSIKLMDKESEEGIFTPFFHSATKMNLAGTLTCAALIDDYVKCTEIMDYKFKAIEAGSLDSVKKQKEEEQIVSVKENLDNLFVNSACATCDAIIPIFKEKHAASPDDLELLKKIIGLMSKQKCTDDELFFTLSDKLHKVEPSAFSAYALAKMALRKENYSKASDYYKQAIELQEDANEKANLYYELAVITGTKLGNRPGGRTYALKALEFKPNWGKPYILIAQFYAASASICGEDELSQKSVYWVAVDKLQRALNDPESASDAAKLISSYKEQYPNKEDAFFRGVQEGQSYTVGCWINESTTVRF